MGIEIISYKNNSIELDNQVISWLQKFMELTLENLEHPDWFKDILDDLNGNFHVAHGKYFFEEAILDNNIERVSYCLKMLDITIAQMESINKKQFFEEIEDFIKGSWCDINNDFYNDEWFSDNENYKIVYIGSLKKIKEMLN